MITGIVVGVVVAIVGAIGNYIAGLKRDRQRYEQESLMQQERWQREDQLDSRNRAIEVKRAARLMDVELQRAQIAANTCVEEKHWWTADAQLTTEAWENHRGVIAPELSEADWREVMIAFIAADDLITMRGNQTGDISEETAESIVPILRDIESGRRSLAPHVRDTPPTSGNAANL